MRNESKVMRFAGAAAATMVGASLASAASPLTGLLGPAGLVAQAVSSAAQNAAALESTSLKPGTTGCAPEGLVGEWAGVGRVLLPGETAGGTGFGFTEKLTVGAGGLEVSGEMTVSAPPPESAVELKISATGAKPELPPLGPVVLPPIIASFFAAPYKIHIGTGPTVTRTGGASGPGYWNEQELGFDLHSEDGAPQPYAVRLMMQVDDCTHRLVAYEFRDSHDALIATVHLLAGRGQVDINPH